ncbi:MAG: NTP transferase domain-containing protein [Flavobacteriales bacterium]|nr:MAG: NTP transferase domain-containing protein [Flavobacteriales bacterium]
MKNTAAIILAGGNSSRMNYPKAWLMINNTTFLESIINIYSKLGIHSIVVLNSVFTENQWKPNLDSIKEKALIVKNYHPDKGRLYSLVLGLNELSTENAVFIHNVDQPLIELEVITQLYKNFEPNGITLPTVNGKNGHPVLIGAPIINEIKNHYNQYQTLKDVWKFFPKKKVEVSSDNVLTNINTIEEYKSLPNPSEGGACVANSTRCRDHLSITKMNDKLL